MKRWNPLPILAAAALATALPDTLLAVPMVMRTTNLCTSPLVVADDATGAELYAFKLVSSSPQSYTDMGFDLSAKGGASDSSFVIASGFSVTLDDNARSPQAPGDAYFVYVTLPPAAVGEACRLLVDSDTAARSGGAMGSTTWQYVGARQGWVLGANACPIITPTRDRDPIGAGAFAGADVRFGGIAELNQTMIGPGCTVSGAVGDPNRPEEPLGHVAGYNVYRLEGSGATPPTRADFMAAGAWQYYVDLYTFDVGVDEMGLLMPQREEMPPRTATTDRVPDTDLAGFHNPDGAHYTGDELLIFQDTARLPDGSTRPPVFGVAPTLGRGYWYGVQPVLGMGSNQNTAFNDIGFTNNDLFHGDHVIDVGGVQGIDLDLDGTPEFYNPQVAAGIQGLGLTNDSLPVLSALCFVDCQSGALPATDHVTLTADLRGSHVDIAFTTSLETADVLGYHVWRLAGSARTKVNRELIAAQGSDAQTYSLVDQLSASSRRVRRAVPIQYEVEIVRTDTPSEIVGPFEVALASALSHRRR
jgi:hypothetical protein